jgi:hypothetical protein
MCSKTYTRLILKKRNNEKTYCQPRHRQSHSVSIILSISIILVVWLLREKEVWMLQNAREHFLLLNNNNKLTHATFTLLTWDQSSKCQTHSVLLPSAFSFANPVLLAILQRTIQSLYVFIVIIDEGFCRKHYS